MKITFLDADGAEIVTTISDADNHWDACAEGHTMVDNQTISGADDFQVSDMSD